MTFHNIVGRYSLIEHGTYDAHNNYSRTSNYLKGEINYSDDGSLSVLILFNESIESGKDILSYIGNFEIKSDSLLIHHITLCSQQKRNNSSEERIYKQEGNKLILGCPLANDSRFEAVWMKQTTI